MSNYISRIEAIDNVRDVIREMMILAYSNQNIDYIVSDENIQEQIKVKMIDFIEIYYNRFDGTYVTAVKDLSYKDDGFKEYYKNICKLAKALKMPIAAIIEKKTLTPETITCDLNNPEEMNSAATQFENSKEIKKAIAVNQETGYTITFKNAEAMTFFIDNDTIADIEEMVSPIANSTSIAQLTTLTATEWVKVKPSLIKALSKSSGFLTVGVIIIDGIQAYRNQNLDTISDFVISGIGILGVPGAVISISLAFTKKSLKEVLPDLGRALLYWANDIMNQITQGYWRKK